MNGENAADQGVGITEKIANFLNVDTDKLNKTAVTSALNLVAGKALGTAIPIATVFNLVKDSFTKSPEEIAAEEQAKQDNIDEAAAITKRIEAAQAAMKPTYEERLMGESWDTLSDNDQYIIAQEYPGETPPRRNPDFVPGLANL